MNTGLRIGIGCKGARIAAAALLGLLHGYCVAAGTTTSDPSRITRTGFLTDYGRLKANPETGIMCWRATDVEVAKFDKILIAPIVVTLKADGKQTIDPADLKKLVDYFHASLESALKPQLQIVAAPGPGVIVMKTALTELVPTNAKKSLVGTAVPFGFVAEAGAGAVKGQPTGSTPYMGQTGVEIQFLDGGSAAVIAECADTQIGRKYAAEIDKGAANAAKTWATGYTSSFQAWAYAKDAFDKWSALIAKRIGVLRGAAAAPS